MKDTEETWQLPRPLSLAWTPSDANGISRQTRSKLIFVLRHSNVSENERAVRFVVLAISAIHWFGQASFNFRLKTGMARKQQPGT